MESQEQIAPESKPEPSTQVTQAASAEPEGGATQPSGEGVEASERWERIEIRDRLSRIEQTLSTLVSWMAKSSHTPIGRDEAAKLLLLLHGEL